MVKKLVVISIAVLLLVLGAWRAAPVRAQSGFPPSDDTWVSFHNPDDNNDGQELVAMYSAFPSCIITGRVFLRFDLSSIGYEVTDSTLVRINTSQGPANSAASLALWSTGDDWNGGTDGLGDETSLTWNNAPDRITKLAVATIDQLASGVWIDFTGADLAAYINSQRTEDSTASFVIEFETCVVGTLMNAARFEDNENSNGNEAYPPVLVPQYPTAVELESFTANAGPGHLVTLDWKTATELDLSGFNLYRSQTLTGTQELLNEALLPSLGAGIEGSVYQFVDRSTAPVTTYHYWLEAVHNQGPPALYGPESATTAGYFVYLPLIVR